jgi:ketosteroid isomerase-like protein
MKTFLTSLLTLSVLTLSFGQTPARYTQSAPEIETIKNWVAAYNAGDWDRVRASYADDIRIVHNGEVITGSDEVVASFQSGVRGADYYQLRFDEDKLERVINDDGETWVNAWGYWIDIPTGSTDTISMPLHSTYQFNAEGKIIREVSYYNTLNNFMKRTANRYGDDNLFFIRELTVKEGQEATYLERWEQWRDMLNENEVPSLFWTSLMREDNVIYHSYSIPSVVGYEGIKLSLPSVWEVVREAMGEAELTEWSRDIDASREAYKEYVVRRVADLSYWPSGPEALERSEVGFFHMYEMEFDLTKYDEHLALVEDIKALAEEVNTSIPYDYHEYVLGGAASRVVVIDFAKDKADYERRKAEEEKLFDTERGRALFQRMESLYTSMQETEGRIVPEISRPWSEN